MTSGSGSVSGRGRNPDIVPSNGSSPEESEDGLCVSDDDMFEVLSNSRRREVIAYLREEDGEVPVGELAEHIATKENETTLQNLSSYQRKRVYVSLYQNHLPMMDKANVVEYAENRKTVRLRETATKLGPYLEDATVRDPSSAPIAAVLLVAATILLGSLQVGAFDTVPVSAWTLLGSVGLVGLTAIEAKKLLPSS